jgi:hypothetical protein
MRRRWLQCAEPGVEGVIAAKRFEIHPGRAGAEAEPLPSA